MSWEMRANRSRGADPWADTGDGTVLGDDKVQVGQRGSRGGQQRQPEVKRLEVSP